MPQDFQPPIPLEFLSQFFKETQQEIVLLQPELHQGITCGITPDIFVPTN